VKVVGSVPHADLTWVIQTIRWGDVIRSETGQRIRQYLSLGLLRYIADDRVAVTNAADRARQNATKASTDKKSSGISTPYTVKQGDTLYTIAQKKLNNYTRASEIARLNGIRDFKSIKVGQKLRMP
jgi:LysM repeat protein